MKINSLHEAKQAAFNGAYRGLQHQKWKPCRDATRCVYSGPNGTHCAVGWLIPKSLYRTEIEGKAPSSLFAYLAAPLRSFVEGSSSADRKEFGSFLYDLQQVHDHNDYTGRNTLHARMKGFAEANKLSIPKPLCV